MILTRNSSFRDHLAPHLLHTRLPLVARGSHRVPRRTVRRAREVAGRDIGLGGGRNFSEFDDFPYLDNLLLRPLPAQGLLLNSSGEISSISIGFHWRVRVREEAVGEIHPLRPRKLRIRLLRQQRNLVSALIYMCGLPLALLHLIADNQGGARTRLVNLLILPHCIVKTTPLLTLPKQRPLHHAVRPTDFIWRASAAMLSVVFGWQVGVVVGGWKHSLLIINML